jgi:hypothetical protein
MTMHACNALFILDWSDGRDFQPNDFWSVLFSYVFNCRTFTYIDVLYISIKQIVIGTWNSVDTFC